MEKEIKNGDGCAQLIDLIPDKREWVAKDRGKGGGNGGYGVVGDEKLELKLGPPGQDQDDDSSRLLSLGFFSKISKIPCAGAKRGFLDTVEPDREGGFPLKTNGGIEELQQGKGCRPPLSPMKSSASAASSNAAGMNNTSQTRAAGVTIVGWPPVRSFRRNLATSSETPPESHKGGSKTIPKTESATKCLFVKINMDGIPIGRKVDLKAYNSYEHLSQAVDELFRGLLAAKKDPPIGESPQKHIGELPPITGLLHGTGEFTLVYEDDEGDRMLVGDVPWNMFVSTVKRLRVLKTSELSTISLAAASRKRTVTDC